MIRPNTLVLFGATSPIGERLTELAVGAGHRVLAVVRPEREAGALEATGAALIRVDVLDPQAVVAATAGVPKGAWFASVLGGPPGSDGRVDWEGNRNAIDAAVAAKAGHFVLVTTVGAGDSRPALPPPVIAVLGLLAEKKTLAEDHLKASGLPWTILRPGHLQAGEATGRAVLLADPLTIGAVRRADVATLMLRSFEHPACRNRCFSVSDLDTIRSAQPVKPVVLE